MLPLTCTRCGHRVEDKGSWNFGLREYPCWCGGTLTNKIAGCKEGDLLMDIAVGFILDSILSGRMYSENCIKNMLLEAVK